MNKQKIEENLIIAEEAKSKLSNLELQIEVLKESEHDQCAYADVVKHERPLMKAPKNVDKTERDPETNLIANPTKSFWNSMSIKPDFETYFPMKRLKDWCRRSIRPVQRITCSLCHIKRRRKYSITGMKTHFRWAKKTDTEN